MEDLDEEDSWRLKHHKLISDTRMSIGLPILIASGLVELVALFVLIVLIVRASFS